MNIQERIDKRYNEIIGEKTPVRNQLCYILLLTLILPEIISYSISLPTSILLKIVSRLPDVCISGYVDQAYQTSCIILNNR